ncbi:chromosome segregation protein ParM [Aeromonas rivipollensis]|uniref:chromosome segregation protein ParM n=1 Tax=Aeromonas rivipollensis TaxID=948519 RepID=UPI0038D1A3ED
MRISTLQQDTLFTLYAIEQRGITSPIPGVKLQGMINAARSPAVYLNNFRVSCHTLVSHGLLEKYRGGSLELAFRLTDAGRERAREIFAARQQPD